MAFKLGLWHPHSNNCGQTSNDVVLLHFVFADLQPARILVNLSADGLDEPRIKARLVRAAFRSLDDVHKTLLNRVVTCAPLDHDIHMDIPRNIG